MTGVNALVMYKNRPALVKDAADGKLLISIAGGEELKVREKDIELIHPGPVKDFKGIEAGAKAASGAIREAWELLLADGGGPVSLKDAAALIFGGCDPASAWAMYCLLADGLYFTGSAAAVYCRKRDEVEAEEKKREEKKRESGERGRFLERLKNLKGKKPEEPPLLPDDARFMQDVEALALGKSSKSRTMKDLGLGETPEEAHALLLEAGFWTNAVNPHPSRCGLSLTPAKHNPGPPPPEERRDLCHLAAFAIDSPWSNDPDDAVSVETGDAGRIILYVHVADPAASITADSPAEREARDRGATLYLPEGSLRMLCEECLSLFALGLTEISPCLTFKITLDSGCAIIDTDIFPSLVKVRRLTYQNADKLLDGETAEAAPLRGLLDLAERNLRRRIACGAVHIDLPETHISVENGTPEIKPIVQYRSASLVRECMLIAGEGAAVWAGGKGDFAFPYVSQEAGDMPDEVLPGMAGSYQLRRCMRPRTLSTKPGRHWGLGLDAYTQVTSPLRRYTDLLAHLQIRALLRGNKPLSADELLARLGAGEAAAAAVVQAERASRAHWTGVFLSGKKDSQWDAVALEKKGNRWALMIPALALETQIPLRKEPAPNDSVTLILKSVNIPKGEAVFVAV